MEPDVEAKGWNKMMKQSEARCWFDEAKWRKIMKQYDGMSYVSASQDDSSPLISWNRGLTSQVNLFWVDVPFLPLHQHGCVAPSTYHMAASRTNAHNGRWQLYLPLSLQYSRKSKNQDSIRKLIFLQTNQMRDNS